MKQPISSRDPRVDAYIESAGEFAQPILRHLRELVHQGCPEVDEKIKWGMPSFEYKGILCGMAAFKKHCVFGFWKHDLLFAESAELKTKGRAKATTPAASDEAVGQLGRITKLSDLPPQRTLLKLIRQAVVLNDAGVKSPRTVKPKQKLVVPKNLTAALRQNPAAADIFAKFSYSKRKDYIEWLTEAKTAETRSRRLATAIEWIAEGKSRNWKYERC